ncbi:MAG: DUF5777 family beta-barrel protein [Bacteroidia bacterium]
MNRYIKIEKVLLQLIVLIISLPIIIHGQDEKKYIDDAFSSTQLINTQTTTMLYPSSWQFEVQHRFGVIGIDSSFTHQFLGLDLPAAMRLSFGWAINERMYLKIGRTNYLKTYDLEWKYLLIRQTDDFRIPVSVAYYGSASINTDKFPNIPAGSVFEDETTPFKYKPNHRLAYNTQFIISSKINDKFSVQVTPVFIYKNLVPAYHDNFYAVVSGGIRYKLGLNSAFTLEYGRLLNSTNRKNNFVDPISLGVEFGTANHIFQIFISNSQRILESQIYTESSEKWTDGTFLIGFNLKRNFWKKN